MTTLDLLRTFPAQRLKPVDGLAVTAAVWEEAHDYHRHHLRLHALLEHGAGIVTGLEVIASDPPDNAVYILPGIAVDSAGQTIVLPEPRSFDLGRAEGVVQILLSYGEGRPAPRDGVVDDGAPLYVRAEFALEATPRPPSTPWVELARLRRSDRSAPAVNAKDAAQPGPNEIDLRYRRAVGAAQTAPLTVAVCNADKQANETHHRGVGHLARFLRGPLGGRQAVWVDDNVPLTAGLEAYALVCLVAHSEFQLTADELKGLYSYLQAGGTLFMESCRRAVADAAPPSDASFLDTLSSLGVTLEPIRPGHRLLTEPALFGMLPAGYETKSLAEVKVGGGVLFSTSDFGCLWQGERRGRPGLRDEIRSALEWGANVLDFAVARRREARPGGPTA